jgi:hypothetical protein
MFHKRRGISWVAERTMSFSRTLLNGVCQSAETSSQKSSCSPIPTSTGGVDNVNAGGYIYRTCSCRRMVGEKHPSHQAAYCKAFQSLTRTSRKPDLPWQRVVAPTVRARVLLRCALRFGLVVHVVVLKTGPPFRVHHSGLRIPLFALHNDDAGWDATFELILVINLYSVGPEFFSRLLLRSPSSICQFLQSST